MNVGTKIVLGLGIAGVVVVGGGVVLAWTAAKRALPAPDDALPPEPPSVPEEPPVPAEPTIPDVTPRPRPAPVPKSPGLGLNVGGSSRLVGVLSQQVGGGEWCDVPILPRATATYRGEVREVPRDAPLAWGWQGPGGKPVSEQPVAALGSRFILALAYQSVTPHGWQGGASEVSSAEYLAPSVHGVMADGIIPNVMRPVLARFAAHDRVGYPVVRVADRPGDRLGAILESWRGVGFSALVPILDVASGLVILRELIEECGRLKLNYLLSSLQQLNALGFGCSIHRS